MDNILIEYGSEGTGKTLYLIDFGLSTPFIEVDKTTGRRVHIKQEKTHRFTGNFIFASLNTCHGLRKSRKDDLESAFYMIGYLLNRNHLPWMYLGS